MQHRNPIAVALLPLVTFGIYSLYWSVKTKGELNKLGASIPTAWLIIIPLVNIWWYWKYCEGVELVTNNKMSTVISFLLIMLLGSIGAAVIQDTFNKHASGHESMDYQPVTATPAATPETVGTPPVAADSAPVAPATADTPANADDNPPTPPTSSTPPPTV